MTRALLCCLVGFLLLTIIAPLQQALGMEQVGVDVSLIIVLHVAMVDTRGGVYRSVSRHGLSRNLLDLPGVVTALLLGYVTDVLAGGLRGVHSLTLGALFLISRMVARQVYMAGAVSQILVTLVASLAASTVALFIRWMIGVPPGIGIVPVVAGQAIATGVAAPVLMRLLRVIDARLSTERTDRPTLRL